MFNRLIPKRQCIRPYSIANRNICGLIGSTHSPLANPHKLNHESLPSSSPHITSTNNTHLSPLLSHHHHHIRHFGTSIKVYNQPDVGEGTVEVDILEWLIKPGDKVTALQTIGRGKYEKADVDILAPTYDGIVHQILVEAGSVALVGKPLVEFAVDDDGTSDISNNSDTTTKIDSSTITKQTSGSPSSVSSNKGILALPATKHFAKEHGIDLSQVIGTGKDGRILKEDVMAFMNGQQSQQKQIGSAPQRQQTQQPIVQPPARKPSPVIAQTKHIHPLKADHVERIFGVKKAMVKKMTEANQVPQFGYGDEIILNELVLLRKQLKPLGEQYGIKITYLPFILKATSLALLNPQSHCLNAYINAECTELTHKGSHNIGVAIDSPEGLIVPNIKFVDQKSILEIAKDLEDLIMRGKNNQITNEDISGGTFTLSNIGAIGGTYCRPICFVPEVCIGALGTIKQFPRYNKQNELYNASVMAVSWSADHRVIDGATVARFANDFKMYLENPASMLMHLS